MQEVWRSRGGQFWAGTDQLDERGTPGTTRLRYAQTGWQPKHLTWLRVVLSTCRKL